ADERGEQISKHSAGDKRQESAAQQDDDCNDRREHCSPKNDWPSKVHCKAVWPGMRTAARDMGNPPATRRQKTLSLCLGELSLSSMSPSTQPAGVQRELGFRPSPAKVGHDPAPVKSA